MKDKFDFEDINLKPKFCVVKSRSECDTSITLGGFKFKLPVIPANMECVIDEALAIKLSQNGYFYILHRFNIDVAEFISSMKKMDLVTSISIGVNEESYLLLNKLVKEDLVPDFITIDIAHGHSTRMKQMLEFINSLNIKSFIIAGNVSTIEATEDLSKWGADCVKVGIGPGCFVPSAEVKTITGIKSIQDISIGDYVITHKNRYKKVSDKHSYYGEQDLIKINNLPPCTETHEFYVIDKAKKDLVNDDNLSEFAFWIKAKDLDKNKHTLIKCE